MGCGSGMLGPKIEEANKTGRKVFCVKFQREMPGLDEAPFDNHPLGSASSRTFPRKPGSYGWNK